MSPIIGLARRGAGRGGKCESAGTRVDGDVLATLERQSYRLCDWHVAGEELELARSELGVGLAIAWKGKTLFHNIFVEDVVPEVPGLRYAGQIFTCLDRRSAW